MRSFPQNLARVLSREHKYPLHGRMLFCAPYTLGTASNRNFTYARNEGLSCKCDCEKWNDDSDSGCQLLKENTACLKRVKYMA